ncbi:hypothetical protein ABZ541_29210 [Micromonospora sediminicola]|uniref:hypothetical protein n=1 Tax=Micromonospora sediminicola TaxID=946078 RepID=UPI0033C86FDF
MRDLYAINPTNPGPRKKLCGGNLQSQTETCAVVQQIAPDVWEVTDSKDPKRPGLRFTDDEMQGLIDLFPAERGTPT